VRPTGEESLAPAFHRVHPENSYKDEQVGYKNYQKRDNQIKCWKNQNDKLDFLSIRAEQGYQGETVTEEMFDDIVNTER
jgi:hypothetical protein